MRWGEGQFSSLNAYADPRGVPGDTMRRALHQAHTSLGQCGEELP